MSSCTVCLSNSSDLNKYIFRATQGQGVMPDKTVRYKCRGKDVYHFMGCSSFSEYSVVCQTEYFLFEINFIF